jgi:2-dehydro-3-deoxygalactonokinase
VREINAELLSCDWGTSSFRLKLVEQPSLRILAEVNNTNGVSSTYQAWKKKGADKETRLSFFLTVIRNAIVDFERQLESSLSGVPIVISGMPSSSIGMINLPYKELPFAVDGSDLLLHEIKATGSFLNDVLIISGVRSEDDVMRGEETQMVGSVLDDLSADKDHLFIFPGTHSKHMTVRKGKVNAFRTYMTGEIFNVLATQSILSESVEGGGSLQKPDNRARFAEGVKEGIRGNLLNNLFHVRTKILLGDSTTLSNYYYLSGLLIGTELNEVASQAPSSITIVGSESIIPYYRAALQAILIAPGDTRSIPSHDAILRGQLAIARRAGFLR